MSILGDRLRGTPTAIAVVFSLLFPGCAFADRNCTDEEKKAADKLLFLNDRDTKASITKHLPWGMPKRALASDERLLAHWDYVIGYDDSLRLPLWTAYRLDAKGINRTPERVNCFRQDPRINSPMASLPSDYEEKNYDQGHLAPSEDMSHTKNQNINSFIMSNMTPQSAPFNQIIWRRLETQARNWAIARKTVYIVNGSIFDKNGDGSP